MHQILFWQVVFWNSCYIFRSVFILCLCSFCFSFFIWLKFVFIFPFSFSNRFSKEAKSHDLRIVLVTKNKTKNQNFKQRPILFSFSLLFSKYRFVVQWDVSKCKRKRKQNSFLRSDAGFGILFISLLCHWIRRRSTQSNIFQFLQLEFLSKKLKIMNIFRHKKKWK